MLNHMHMARREVLVQLDDQLVAQLDALAAEHGTSRSELLRRGALAVIQAEDNQKADAALRASYRWQPQDPAIVAVAQRLATESSPTW
jgi:hypothetical protein